MRYNREPPYDLLASRDFPFAQMQRFKRFAKYFDLFVNHGIYPRSMALLIEHAGTSSPFAALLAFSDWLWATTGQDYALARSRQFELLLDYLTLLGVPEAQAILAFSTRDAAVPVRKVLESAMANADHNAGLDVRELYLTRVTIDEGPTMRRFRPRAQGRASRINKRTCHITIGLGLQGSEAEGRS